VECLCTEKPPVFDAGTAFVRNCSPTESHKSFRRFAAIPRDGEMNVAGNRIAGRADHPIWKIVSSPKNSINVYGRRAKRQLREKTTKAMRLFLPIRSVMTSVCWNPIRAPDLQVGRRRHPRSPPSSEPGW